MIHIIEVDDNKREPFTKPDGLNMHEINICNRLINKCNTLQLKAYMNKCRLLLMLKEE